MFVSQNITFPHYLPSAKVLCPSWIYRYKLRNLSPVVLRSERQRASFQVNPLKFYFWWNDIDILGLGEKRIVYLVIISRPNSS